MRPRACITVIVSSHPSDFSLLLAVARPRLPAFDGGGFIAVVAKRLRAPSPANLKHVNEEIRKSNQLNRPKITFL